MIIRWMKAWWSSSRASPASGKTTFATALSAELWWPLISKDVVKEALF
jgi:hypothetical protein